MVANHYHVHRPIFYLVAWIATCAGAACYQPSNTSWLPLTVFLRGVPGPPGRRWWLQSNSQECWLKTVEFWPRSQHSTPLLREGQA